MYNQQYIDEFRQTYETIKDGIIVRLNQFKKIWKTSDDNQLFGELVFCLLTPQSRAKSCGKCVELLIEKESLFNDDAVFISKKLTGVRFHNNKAKYIVKARKQFLESDKISLKSKLTEFNNIFVTRDWFVKNVSGMGYKEASHFLRNIGLGNEIAILDRHILKNLNFAQVIKEIPAALSPKKYLEIENEMRLFSNKIDIPLSHLDFVLWYKEAGEIYK